MLIRALIVLSVVSALAALIVLRPDNTPAIAQDESPTPTATIEAPDLEGLCREFRVINLESQVSYPGMNGDPQVTLRWIYDFYPGKFGDLPVNSYRIEKRDRDADASSDWIFQALTSGGYDLPPLTWTGDAEPGSWHYRVALIETELGDVSGECEPHWEKVSVQVLTAAEQTQAELETHCRDMRAYAVDLGLAAELSENWPDKSLTLSWRHPMGYQDKFVDYSELAAIHYRIERSAVSEPGDVDWETVAVLMDETTWTGPGEPGRWRYRVGWIGLQRGDVFVACEPQWATTHVTILTEAERAKSERQRSILIAESTRCATRQLTSNLRSAASAVVGEYIEERVNQIVAESYDPANPTRSFGELVVFTILMCSDSGPSVFGLGSGMPWAMFLLFED